LAEAMLADGARLDRNHAVLRQISAGDPEAVHVSIYDQAGFHPNTDTSPVPVAPLRFISLPP
jgi:hypothetical protein